MAEERLNTAVTVPLVEEVADVAKRRVETGRVSVALTTDTIEEVVRETLRGRRAEVERVSLGHEVSEVPTTREEGNLLVIPVLEEILVVEKRLVLREEIRVRFIETEEQVEEKVERRIQQADISRSPAAGREA